MAQEMIFAQDWSAIDSKNYTERKDPVYGLVTVFHDVIIAREIVQPYELDGKMVMAYKSAEELEQYWPWVDGRWAIAGRHPDTPVIVKPGDIAGRTVNPRFVKNLTDIKTERKNIRGIAVDLEVFNDRVAPDILRGMKLGELPDVSIGFLYGKEMTPGTWNGYDYDLRQVNMFHDHTAFGIKKGRCAYPACGIGADSLLEAKCLNEGCKNRTVSIMDGSKTEENDTLISISVPEVDTCEDAQIIPLSNAGDVSFAVCGDDHQIVSYHFSKAADWTMEKAEAWVEENREGAADQLAARLVVLAEAVVVKARAMEHYGVTADVWGDMPEKVRAGLITGLPEEQPFPGKDMSEDEIKDKIAEIQKQINEFYESKERADPVDYSAVEPLYAEMNAYKEALAEAITARVVETVADDEADSVDQVARAKKLLNDPRLKRESISLSTPK